MAKQRARGCLSYIIGCLALLAAVIGWADFLFKPITQSNLLATRGAAVVAADLMRPVPTIYGWPGAGYLFFLSGLLLGGVAIILIARPIRWIWTYIYVSEAPVSVLESEIELYMEDAALARCRVSRRQRLHANRPNVTAYHHTKTAMNGMIDHAGLTIESRIDNKLITERLIKRVAGKTVEVIETFQTPLPTSRWLTYLPNRVVLALADNLGWFTQLIVERRASNIDHDEYNGTTPVYQVAALPYPASSITIRLDFPALTAPAEADVQAFLITSYAVEVIPVVPDLKAPAGRKIYSACLKSLKTQQMFRVQWSNTRLEQARAQQPALFATP